jgi:hypothetical protein
VILRQIPGLVAAAGMEKRWDVTLAGCLSSTFYAIVENFEFQQCCCGFLKQQMLKKGKASC